MPVFNLMKIHGSLTWKIGNDDKSIEFLPKLETTQAIAEVELPDDKVVELNKDSTLEQLVEVVAKLDEDPAIDRFLESYEQLAIVNPNPEKFKHTLLNQTYYEMLRIYSNELEKENSVLFVAGFSFADQHIREVTLRAANSNPTLVVYIIAYSKNAADNVESLIDFEQVKNSNIKIIAPKMVQKTKGAKPEEERKYDLKAINELIFSKLVPNGDAPKEDEVESGTLESI